MPYLRDKKTGKKIPLTKAGQLNLAGMKRAREIIAYCKSKRNRRSAMQKAVIKLATRRPLNDVQQFVFGMVMLKERSANRRRAIVNNIGFGSGMSAANFRRSIETPFNAAKRKALDVLHLAGLRL